MALDYLESRSAVISYYGHRNETTTPNNHYKIEFDSWWILFNTV